MQEGPTDEEKSSRLEAGATKCGRSRKLAATTCNGASLAPVARVPHRVWLTAGVRGGFAGDQASAETEGQKLESPLNENQDAALKLHDVNQVDKQPHQPGQQTRNVEAINIGHRGGAANHGHLAFV